MFEPIRKIFAVKPAKRRASTPQGERAYLIGDIHGRLDLFEQLITAIEADDSALSDAKTTVILLGDLIDRGPESAGVIKLAQQWAQQRQVRCLMGNHEEMFLESFEDTTVLRHFLKHGGRETILSYGITRKEFNQGSLDELQIRMQSEVPESDLEFVAGFEDMIVFGDYLAVHAGINPKKPIEDQVSRELRWIREPFLKHKDKHSHIVIHGHTITEEVDERKNRIGIDTGAYKTGRLTALVLEGETRRYIQAVEKKSGAIKIIKKDENR